MISLHRSKVLGLLPLIGALAGVIGCGAETGSSQVDAAGDVAQAQQKDVAGHGRHGRRGGGPEGMLFAALHELDLSAAQKTAIEGAIEKMKASRPEPRPQDRAVLTTLAAGVRAGKIDGPAVLAQAGNDDRGPEAHRAAVAQAIETLHATLTKDQRRALVDAMAKHGPKGDKGEKGDRGDRPEGKKDRGPRGAGMEHGPGPIGFMLHDLDLTDAQRASIDSALAARKPAEADREAMKKRFEAMHAEMRARQELFVADAFDAKAFVAPPEGKDGMGPKQHMQRMIDDLSVIVPILQPAQREALAAKLEKGPPPMGHHGGPPGMGERGPRSAPEQ